MSNRDILLQARQGRKQTELQLSLLMSRINMLQQNQIKVVRRIQLQQKQIESKPLTQSMQRILQPMMMQTKMKKHLSEEGRKKSQEHLRFIKLQETEKLKTKMIELNKQVQQQRESEQIKNMVRYQKIKQERMCSQMRKRIRQQSIEELKQKEYFQQTQIECQKRIQTEFSIRKLVEKEQQLLQDLQHSQQLSSTFSRQLDPRHPSRIRARSYYIQ